MDSYSKKSEARHREFEVKPLFQDKEAEAKLRTEAIKRKAIAAVAWKPNICAAAVLYAREIELKQTISQKTSQIKNLNTKLKKMAPECKLNCVEDVTVISWKPYKPPICAVEKAGEMELEQIISAKSNEINDLNSKLKEMKQEINAYKIKLKDMEQRSQCSDVAIDIDVDVDVEVNEEMKKNNCAPFAIAPICCVLVFGLGFGGLCLYFKKYI